MSMNSENNKNRRLITVLALVLLAGCFFAAGSGAAKAADDETSVVRVSTVDELLAAIAPNTVIELAPGEYDLSTAANYGSKSDSPYYSWNSVWGDEDGKIRAELVIQGVDGLTLRGSGLEKTRIAAVPRYANVMKFIGCRKLALSNLTAGHTTEPGFCSGGVLYFENCTGTGIDACGLYGCGTIGVYASDCSDLTVANSRIYECSFNAVNVCQCRNVRIENCDICKHGKRKETGAGIALFDAYYSEGFTVHGCRIYDNVSQMLLQSSHTKNAVFLSNEVRDNRFEDSVFLFEQYGATVDGCVFADNGTVRTWVRSSGVYANDVTGKLLEASDFETMSFRAMEPDIAVTPAPAAAAADVPPGGSVEVTSVDEFLSAIGPDRTIILNGELFDLSSASNYGSIGGEYYYWEWRYDGPQLVIRNVDGMTVRSKAGNAAETTVAAIPRYADVLSFRSCSNILLADFTAGHTKEPGSCAGGVLNFEDCSGLRLDSMRLYGCGVLGIQAAKCTTFDILRSEIYECSMGAGQFSRCDGIRFLDCSIHDVPSPALSFTECGDVTWNNEPYTDLNGTDGASVNTGAADGHGTPDAADALGNAELGCRPDDLVGRWAEKIAGRGLITIKKTSEGEYSVLIDWPSSAFERAIWEMTATPAGEGGALKYEDAKHYVRTFQSDTEYTDELKYENGSGMLYLNSANEVMWEDKVDQAGENCVFISTD
ncbi:MAG: right-handed parallel beta-helix repeat-containing protein [Oscillospiraceae bacterium]|nr:right-handed parallel beta-helix repeat-containing protein [Oscillospiraceae bacterium]